MNVGIVSGHLLCASEEFPLVGSHSVTSILSAGQSNNNDNLTLSDHDLFGCEETYREAFESILDRKQIRLEKVNDHTEIETYSNHPSIQKPSLNVSLRSIEPINYSIVDLNHPGQEGTQLICKEAVLDNIPYSRYETLLSEVYAYTILFKKNCLSHLFMFFCLSFPFIICIEYFTMRILGQS